MTSPPTSGLFKTSGGLLFGKHAVAQMRENVINRRQMSLFASVRDINIYEPGHFEGRQLVNFHVFDRRYFYLKNLSKPYNVYERRHFYEARYPHL